jgi:xylose isomerase
MQDCLTVQHWQGSMKHLNLVAAVATSCSNRYCAHSTSAPSAPTSCRDIAPEGATLAETNKNLDLVAEVALELQKGTNIRPLWGTAQLFKHPRYMHGAATSEHVDYDALLYASRQAHAQATATESCRCVTAS